jgi:hypothetical protein
MGKADRLSILSRHKRLAVAVGSSLVAILAVTSAVFTIGGWHLTVVYLVPFTAVAVMISIVLARRANAPQFLPIELLGLRTPDDAITLLCPADTRLRSQAKRLAAEAFKRSFVLDPNIYEQLWLKNNYILACLCDENEKLRGFFDVIPLRASFGEPLLQGRMSETQMTHDDVLSPSEMGSCEYLYIAGIAVENPSSFLARSYAYILIWGLLEYLNSFYGSTDPLLIAVASTEQGKALLEKFGLKWVNGADQRLDGGNLYAIRMSKREIERRQEWIGDWSKICTLSWKGKSNVVQLKDAKRPRRPSAAKIKQWDIQRPNSATK